MAYEFELPDVGEGIAEAEVLKWMVDVGDGVLEDDPVAEVETERAIIEIPSPVDGKVRRFHAVEGETVEVGEPLVTFERGKGGEETRDDGGVEILDSDGNAAVDVDAEGGNAGGGRGEEEKEQNGDEGGDGTTATAEATRRLAREMGVSLEDIDGSGEDGRVLAQDILHAAKEEQEEREEKREEEGTETEAEKGSQGDGHGRQAEEPTDEVTVPGKGEKTPTREESGTAPEFGQGEAPAVEPHTAEDTSMFSDEEEDGEQEGEVNTGVRAEERVKEMSKEDTESEDDDGEEGTAEADEDAARDPSGDDGDIFNEGEEGDGVTDETDASDGTDGSGDEDASVRRDETQERGALMTHHDVADAERLVEARETMRDHTDAEVGYTALLTKACASAVEEHGALGEKEEGADNRFGVGVAVEGNDGVTVAVVENASGKGVAEIAAEIEGGGVGRDGGADDAHPDEPILTLVNVGAVGGDGVSPVVGKPGVVAVSVGEIRERPSVVDGDVVARWAAPLHLTFDGDDIDTAEAARLAEVLKSRLTEPAVMLL